MSKRDQWTLVILGIGLGMWIGSWLDIIPKFHGYLPWSFLLAYPVLMFGMSRGAPRDVPASQPK